MRILPLFLFPCLLLTACATGLVKRDALPADATLLGSIDGACRTVVYIEDGVPTRPGETSVIEMESRRPLDWECLADPAADKEDFDCPAGTQFLRVRHTGEEGRFTVECFG